MNAASASCMMLGLLSAGAMAQQPADSMAVPPPPQLARDSVQPMSHARFDADPVRDSVQIAPRVQLVSPVPRAAQPLREATMPRAVERVAKSNSDRSWQIALDFADISDSALNKRHFNQSEDQTTLCCFDVAWLPLTSSKGWIQAGAFGNLGGWHQVLSDGSTLDVVDFSVGPTLLGVVDLWPGWKGWGRLELGVSNLLIDRNTTGMDWGWAGAVRTGLAFPMGDALGFFGAGFDFRDYWHLDVKNVPVLNLFVGVWI